MIWRHKKGSRDWNEWRGYKPRDADNHQRPEEGKADPSQSFQGAPGLADTLVSNMQPPGLWDHKFLFLRPKANSKQPV